MVKMVLSPGDRVEITLKDTDRTFMVEWGMGAMTIHANVPDAIGREGVIYHGVFVFVVPDSDEQRMTSHPPELWAGDEKVYDHKKSVEDEIAAFKKRMEYQRTLVRIEFADRGMEIEDVLLAIQRNDHQAFSRLMAAFNVAKKDVP